MQKRLIAIFMVALMLITVLSAVVTVNATPINKGILEENNDSGESGLGFILCIVYIIDLDERTGYMARRVTFELTDLWTGEVIQAFRFFGIILFTFLPLGHDYELKISTSEGSKTEIIEDLGFFYKSSMTINI